MGMRDIIKIYMTNGEPKGKNKDNANWGCNIVGVSTITVAFLGFPVVKGYGLWESMLGSLY